jgi:hypothetical protein
MIESEPAAQAVSSQAARDADLGPGPVAGPPRESDMVDPLGVVGDESASDLYQRASLLPARHIALPRDPNGHFRR